MKMDNRRHGIKLLALFLSLSAVFLLGHGCGGGSGGSDSGTIPPPTTSVVITGTVPGTVAIAYDYATGMEAARNVASGTPKTFSLSVAPGEYYLMFIENEGTPTQRSFAFRNVTGGNVFTFKANTTLDLGVLVFDNFYGTAKPQIDPISGNGNVTESSAPEASFSPGAGEWTVTRKFVNSTCSGHSPGATVTGNVKIAQGFGIVTFTPAGTTGTAIGVANANTAILTASAGALETIYLTMQSDGSLAGTYSKVEYSGGCSEEGTLTAVLSTSPPVPPPATTLTGLSIKGPSSISEYSFAAYAATATWSDGSASAVASAWSVTPQVAEISAGGVLTCPGGVASDQMVTITATYSAGGITETATMDVTITNVLSIATSVVIMGTVPGTVAIAYDYATGMEAARNVASGTPKTFSLSVAPGEFYLMFIANEGTPTQRSFAFRNVTGGNVFTFKENTTLDLGVLDFNNLHFLGSAVPLIDPISGNNNVTESFMPEAIFSPGPGEWIATRKYVNSTCPGHSPGTTITENVTIAQGFGIVTFTPAGTTETAIGVANVNTAILTASASALETIYLTMQSDGSLAGTYSKVGYSGGCSEDATITAVLSTSPPPAATFTFTEVTN